MTQIVQASNYSCYFASLQLFKQNICSNKAGRWDASAGQTVETGAEGEPAVQFITAVTLFTAREDKPEALHSAAAPHRRGGVFNYYAGVQSKHTDTLADSISPQKIKNGMMINVDLKFSFFQELSKSNEMHSNNTRLSEIYYFVILRELVNYK